MAEVLAIIGAGSLRCAPPIVASLATYFGERPLDIAMYDADAERLDLFERLARACFSVMRSTHALTATTDPDEAVEGATRVVVAVDENCAARFARSPLGRRKRACDSLNAAMTRMLRALDPTAAVLSLLPASADLPASLYFRLDWPDEPTDAEVAALPHQVLRWIRGEDPLHGFLESHARSPFKAWLDDVHSAPLVEGR